MENQMEKKMENEMETLGPFKGVYRDITPIDWVLGFEGFKGLGF